jgi:parallel beta-helix repeat protein
MGSQTNVVTGRAVLVFLAVLVGAAAIAGGGMGGGTLAPRFFYVDATDGDDSNEGLTPGTAFATIQKAIETAADGDAVLVYPGLYRGEVSFQGKSLLVQGVAAATGPGIPVLHNPGDFAVSFIRGEGPDSILSNFVIKSSFMAVHIAGSSPTISNLTVVENTYGIAAYAGSEPEISNCIFWKNAGADLFECQTQFSRTSQAGPGQGNITDDPLFVDPNAGDYHVFSERGRYWPEHDIWVLDQVTSPCIDGGDQNVYPSDEPVPNGERVNMGAYGGTAQAGMSPPRLPGRAFNPSPSNGATEVDRLAILSWDPGSNSVLHDVYFGTENPLPLVSSQAMTQFDPGRMDSDTMYYWRIDEVDGDGNKTAGALWEFTTTSAPEPKGRACFVPETGVWVNGALVSISKVCAGRSVVSVDRVETKKVSPHLPYPQLTVLRRRRCRRICHIRGQ